MSTDSTTSDAMLVTQTLSGQRRAFDVLVRRYLRMVQAVAYAHTRDGAEAEDVAQETFIKAFTSLHTLRDSRRFPAWLATIARHTCARFTSKAQRRREAEEHAAPSPPEPGNPAEQHDVAEFVRAHVATLRPHLREALLLHYFAGHSIAELAEILDISPDAAAKRLQRGREVLGGQLLNALGVDAATAATEKRAAKICCALAAAVPAWQTASGTAAAGATAWSVAGALKAGIAITAGAVALLTVAMGVVWFSGGQDAYVTVVAASDAPPAVPVAVPPDSGAATEEQPAPAPATASTRLEASPSTPSEWLTAKTRPFDGVITSEDGSPVAGARLTLWCLGDFELPEIVVHSSGNAPERKELPAAMANAMLSSFARDAEEHPEEKPFRKLTAHSEADGAFHFDSAPETGGALLRVEAEGFLTEHKLLTADEREGSQRVVLRLGVPFRGRVLTCDGEPCGNAIVQVSAFISASAEDGFAQTSAVGGGGTGGGFVGTMSGEWTRTDDDGWFTLYLAQHGVSGLRVCSDLDGQCSFYDLATDAEDPAVLRMSPMVTLTGSIRWTDGAPAAGCVVRLQPVFRAEVEIDTGDGNRFGGGGGGGGALTEGAVVGADGDYAHPNLSPTQQYVAHIFSPDGERLVAGVEVPALHAKRANRWHCRIPRGARP